MIHAGMLSDKELEANLAFNRGMILGLMSKERAIQKEKDAVMQRISEIRREQYAREKDRSNS